jgi:hypothetical protein
MGEETIVVDAEIEPAGNHPVGGRPGSAGAAR